MLFIAKSTDLFQLANCKRNRSMCHFSLQTRDIVCMFPAEKSKVQAQAPFLQAQ